MIRTFIAIDVPAEVRSALTAVQQRLRRVPANVRVSWGKIENLHLTLQFLGYVAEETVPALSAALAEVVRAHPPVDVTVCGVGGFPDVRRPRVLWAGCETGAAELAALAVAVQRANEPLGFVPEDRPFVAHLTLGRIRHPRPDLALTRALDSLKNAALGAMRVEQLHLYQSELHPAGSIYTKLASHPLTGG